VYTANFSYVFFCLVFYKRRPACGYKQDFAKLPMSDLNTGSPFKMRYRMIRARNLEVFSSPNRYSMHGRKSLVQWKDRANRKDIRAFGHGTGWETYEGYGGGKDEAVHQEAYTLKCSKKQPIPCRTSVKGYPSPGQIRVMWAHGGLLMAYPSQKSCLRALHLWGLPW
jgi:hypothetical protein